MTEILILVFCVLLFIIGFIGCFVHKIPGPLIAFIGILIYRFAGAGGDAISASALVLCAVAVVLSMILTHHAPKLTKKIAKFGKGGTWGSIVGSLLGLALLASVSEDAMDGFFPALLMLIVAFGVIPFALSYLFEFASRKDAKAALMPAVAAYVTFLSGMLIKLAVCVYCVYAVFTAD